MIVRERIGQVWQWGRSDARLLLLVVGPPIYTGYGGPGRSVAYDHTILDLDTGKLGTWREVEGSSWEQSAATRLG